MKSDCCEIKPSDHIVDASNMIEWPTEEEIQSHLYTIVDSGEVALGRKMELVLQMCEWLHERMGEE